MTTVALVAGAAGAGDAAVGNTWLMFLDRRDRQQGLFRDERLEAVTNLLTVTDEMNRQASDKLNERPINLDVLLASATGCFRAYPA